MHSQKIAHMDIKPQNLVLGEDDMELKIIDFGHAISCYDMK